MSSTTVTSAPTRSATSSTGATTATATQSGGIPEFPYQMLGVGILALVMAISYLTARHHTEHANRLVVTTWEPHLSPSFIELDRVLKR
jgi:hypothetical protein